MRRERRDVCEEGEEDMWEWERERKMCVGGREREERRDVCEEGERGEEGCGWGRKREEGCV